MSKIFNANIARHTERRMVKANPALAIVPSPVTDLDRAWRAVDALGGRHDGSEWQLGYAAALDAACAAIEKLGGRNHPDVDKEAAA